MGMVRSYDVVLAEIADRFGELRGLDATGLTADEVLDRIIRAETVRAMAEAEVVRAAGTLDTSKAWQLDGSRSPASWMAWRCRISRGRAAATLKCARDLRHMPVAEQALLEGRLTADHVRLLAGARRAAPDAYDSQEEQLVGLAGELTFREFSVAIEYWCQLHAPDGAEGDAADRYEARRAHCSKTFEGMVALDALFDPVGGAIFIRELDRLEQELFEADWRDARTRLGDAATEADLRRTPKQRRLDALRLMAERSAAKAPGATEPRVLLHVLAGDKSVERMCELSDGSVVTPGEVLPVLTKADVERVIFDGPSKVIDLGVRRRLFTGATRTAVEMRDRTCSHPGCDVPAERCEIDHIQPYELGGLTVQANGRCYCKFHHRWHHRRGRPAA